MAFRRCSEWRCDERLAYKRTRVECLSKLFGDGDATRMRVDFREWRLT